MIAGSSFSSGWIFGLYVLVGLVGWGAWARHAAPPGQDSVGSADRPAPSQTRAVETLPAGVEAAAAAVPDPPAARSETFLAQHVAVEPAKLQLIESPPADDPAVRARQQAIPLGVNGSLAGFRPFPDDNPWNQRIDDAPVDPLSDILIRSLGADVGLHPCFGSGEYEGSVIGIPYVVVSSAQPLAAIEFTEYPAESDAGPYPVPPLAPIEGAPSTEADRHVLVIDRDRWKLYELFHAFEVAGGWKAASGAVWDLSSNATRPAGWTSADAAGLPVFPGLVRYDEVQSGEIRHALRFTASRSRKAYVPPASHWASPHRDPALPPMGMRVRLKRTFDVTKFPRDVQVVLRCLQTYGMILADNGSDWFISGAPDERWDNDAMHLLKQVKGRDFEVLRMDGLVAE